MHPHTKEDNHSGNPYTYPQPVLLQAGLHPGSKLDRRGGSKFIRRGQSVQLKKKAFGTVPALPRLPCCARLCALPLFTKAWVKYPRNKDGKVVPHATKKENNRIAIEKAVNPLPVLD
jgi:hypothetical protein